jgi:hypothetical protein
MFSLFNIYSKREKGLVIYTLHNTKTTFQKSSAKLQNIWLNLTTFQKSSAKQTTFQKSSAKLQNIWLHLF